MTNPPNGKRRQHRQRRKSAFLRDNPICCFCGDSASIEPDHCPARICFRGKEGPEDWVFPACSACNRSISGTEQVIAFYIRTLDHTDENYREADLARLLSGLKNNHPDLMPRVHLPAIEKRKMLRHVGHQIEPKTFLDDVPIMAMPKGIDRHVQFFARKLTAAVFYKLHGFPVTPEHRWMCRWFPSYDNALDDLLEEFKEMWNHLIVGSRSNIDFGDQFSVIAATSKNDDVISFIAQFGTSLCFWCGVGKPPHEEIKNTWESYRPIKFGM